MKQNFEIKEIALSEISDDKTYQCRDSLDEDALARYAELDASTMPPIDVVVNAQGQFVIADGFHRCEARKRARDEKIKCRVLAGLAPHEVCRMSISANDHGVPLTAAGRKKACQNYLLSLQQARVVSPMYKVAQTCGISASSARKYYDELVAGKKIEGWEFDSADTRQKRKGTRGARAVASTESFIENVRKASDQAVKVKKADFEQMAEEDRNAYRARLNTLIAKQQQVLKMCDQLIEPPQAGPGQPPDPPR